jgi:superfamily II DNA or RNA helicase
MVMAHREELVEQAAQKLRLVCNHPVEIEKAQRYACTGGLYPAQIIVSSVPTLKSQSRRDRFDPSEFSLVVVDEAHHAVAPSYRKCIDHFRSNAACRILGVTATPDRKDEAALGRVFDDVAFDMGMEEAIRLGWLVPVLQRFVLVDDLDFSMVRTTAGDLNGADLQDVMEREKNLHGVVMPTVEIAGDRRTIVFASGVDHAERMCEIINRVKPGSAVFVCGATPDVERKMKMDAFRRGDCQFLCNVGIATEGFDCPEVSVVAVARPTKSRALYSQMIGRGTRPLPGLVDLEPDSNGRVRAISNSDKPHLEVLDFVGNSGRHKLICTGDILGGNYDDDVLDYARSAAAERDAAVDMDEELRKASIAIAKQKSEAEAKRRAAIRARVQYRTEHVNPFDVLNILPGRTPGYMKHKPVSPRQRAALLKWGVEASDLDKLDIRQASRLMDDLLQRRKSGMATYKQLRLLKRKGVKGADRLTFDEASQMIDQLLGRGRRMGG